MRFPNLHLLGFAGLLATRLCLAIPPQGTPRPVAIDAYPVEGIDYEPLPAVFVSVARGGVKEASIEIINRQPAPNPAAGGHIKYGIQIAPSASNRFCKRRGVRVVIHANRNMREVPHPFGEFEIVPAFNVMGATNPAGAPIHGAAKSNPYARHPVHIQEISERLGNLVPDAGAARQHMRHAV